MKAKKMTVNDVFESLKKDHSDIEIKLNTLISEEGDKEEQIILFAQLDYIEGKIFKMALGRL